MKVEVFYLKDSQGRYTNGLFPTDKWSSMKPGDEVQSWLYVGAQRGKIFDFVRTHYVNVALAARLPGWANPFERRSLWG